MATADQRRLLQKRIFLVKRIKQLPVPVLLICVFCIAKRAFGFKATGFTLGILTVVSSLAISLRVATISVDKIKKLLDK